jgi:hypothetical protein
MFGIPWRLIVGIILGAVIVKESHRASGAYDSAKRKITEAAREAKDSWDATKPSEPAETHGDNPTLK